MQSGDPPPSGLTDWLRPPTGDGAATPAPAPVFEDPDATRIHSPAADLTQMGAPPAASTHLPHPPAPPKAPVGDIYLAVGQRFEQFEVVERLGQGGFSVVYKVYDHRLQTYRALKEYMPREFAVRGEGMQVEPRSERDREIFQMGLKSFIAEGVTLAKFDHPSLVRVYQNMDANGTAYMVMQLVEGSTLDEVVDKMPTPPDEAWLLKLLDPLTSALDVVHQAGIVHRDIKPPNVMLLKGSGKPLLLDFGAARQVMDRAGPVTGMLTPGYAPVEQYPDSGLQQGPWTDIFALAATMHRVLTGKAPINVLTRQTRDAYVPLAVRLAGKYSPKFLQALDDALIVDPNKRPHSMAQFRAAIGLGEANTGTFAASKSAGKADARGKPAGRAIPWVWAGGGAGLLAAIVAGVVLFSASGGPKPVAQAPVVAAPVAQTPVSTPAPAPVPAQEAAAPLAAAPAAPVPTPSVAVATEPAEAFDQILKAASADYQVSLTIEQPRLKVRVTPLQLQLTSSRPGWYYVLIHDTDQEVRVLFPRIGRDDNRITPGQPVKLPPKGVHRKSGIEQAETMAFGEPLGAAKLLAIVSDAPLDFKQALKKEEDGLRVLVQGDAAKPIIATLANGRPLYLGVPRCEAGTACAGLYGAASGDFSVVK